MLYPANLDQHGPARSMEEYLDWLHEQMDAERDWARRIDLSARIRGIEDEINARSGV